MHSDFFYRQLLDHGFGPFTGVPCSIVKDLISHIEQSQDSDYYIATSEGEAMGIAGGLSLAGSKPVAIMQNDGFGNAINPLSSLQLLYKLPALLIITWRAEPGTKKDAPQHEIMGQTLLGLLDIFQIPYTILDDNKKALRDATYIAKTHVEETGTPYAFIIRRSFFEKADRRKAGPDPSRPLRIDFIKLLVGKVNDADLILGTTGYTGRELNQAQDRAGNFYTAGSMGCIGSVGLGVALQHPDRKVYVLDGDGALLMKMGTLASIALYHPENLIHIVFDNGQYESTGGQATAAKVVDFPGVALGAGYRYATSTSTLEQFEQFLDRSQTQQGPTLCHIKVQPGTLPDLKRPSKTPEELRDQFTNFVLSDATPG